MTLRTISYGGGVQSTALLVLAAQGRIDFPVALFANTGDDSENPHTLAYVREVATPYAAEHSVEVLELSRTYADGRKHSTLLEYMTAEGSRSMPIPMRQSGGVPASRTCTAKWKSDVLARWRKEHGATPDDPCVVAIGFSIDEMHRANPNRRAAHEVLVYPLLMDLRMTRADCTDVIRHAGLPVPPKSACWFCPWMRVSRWAEVRRDDPDRFEDAADLEEYLSDRSRYFGKGPLYMSDTLAPMRESIPAAQATLFGEADAETDGCDSGWCFT